ncbi:MAG: hypothetical protein FWD68_03295 [Alphaproteobacteria bacterium]|nr:hypothetical protein [Alphaproteobacteria bacterium]
MNISQIRDIYSARINDWKDVGGSRGKIMAFQGGEGRASQVAMLVCAEKEKPAGWRRFDGEGCQSGGKTGPGQYCSDAVHVMTSPEVSESGQPCVFSAFRFQCHFCLPLLPPWSTAV